MNDKQQIIVNEKEIIDTGLLIFAKIIASEIIKDRFSKDTKFHKILKKAN